jgi:predicted adenine nucleotide alpha hydrolase (AANH) superfamily ATPase
MRLLLHLCCGPCAGGAIPFWRQRAGEVTGFFYNPNVHPFLEFRRRLTGARDVADLTKVELTIDEAYDPEAWFAAVSATAGGKESRCYRCIAHRLERTAREASLRGCDAFSTSLSISPWQDHAAIISAGEQAQKVHGVEFLYEDLRPAYGESRRFSREHGIYRQKYCGCIVSEWERYRGHPPAGLCQAGSPCG